MRIDQHLLQIHDILLQTGGHLVNLNQVMPIVLVKHALDTHRDGALLAEVLNGLVEVARTKHVVVAVYTYS